MDKQAVIYIRVSTDEQKRSGLGAEAQEAACRAFCVARGYEVLGVFKDLGVSGRDDPEGRRGFGEVLELYKAHPAVRIIIHAVSRLSRRQSHLWRLLDSKGSWGLPVESASEPFDTVSPMGRAMLGMLGVWAQLEADMCSERTKAALAARKARGFCLGPKHTIEVDYELVESIVKMRKQGFSLSRITRELNLQGIPGIKGGRWYEMSVSRVLKQWAKYQRQKQLAVADQRALNSKSHVRLLPDSMLEAMSKQVESDPITSLLESME